MATPLTTPAALGIMQQLAGVQVTDGLTVASPESVKDFYAHLQAISGVEINAKYFPACFTAGLPAICSFWMTLIF